LDSLACPACGDILTGRDTDPGKTITEILTIATQAGVESARDFQLSGFELLEELGRTSVPDGVTVRLTANGGPRTIVGHYEPLRRAFANLYRNASEAMQGMGPLDVTVTGDGAGLGVTIADHGPGIPADLRQRIFEPYFTTKRDGTGLGLALVRVTLEAHRGTIAVSETPGGGATFAIVFPPASGS